MAVVGIAVFELYLPTSQSLKDKRRVIRSLIDRLHRRHRISIAETGYQDLRQRTEISMAVVAATSNDSDRLLGLLRSAAEDLAEAEISSWQQDTIDL